MNTTSKDFFICVNKIIVAHQYSFTKNNTYNCLEGRNSYGLVYIMTGELEFRFMDGRRLKVKSGDFFLLKPKDAYKTTCISHCEHYTVNFILNDASINGEITRKIFLSDNNPLIHETELQNAYTNLLSELCAIWKEKKEGYNFLAKSK